MQVLRIRVATVGSSSVNHKEIEQYGLTSSEYIGSLGYRYYLVVRTIVVACYSCQFDRSHRTQFMRSCVSFIIWSLAPTAL
jgi:hypothetical protein